MENSNWVEQQMAQLAPPADWAPDAAAALSRHRNRRRDQWRSGPGFWWKAAIAAGLILGVAAAPPTRALAQRLWTFLTVGRVEVLQLDLDLLPKKSSLRAKQLHPPVLAREVAGFVPSLPPSTVLRGSPQTAVFGPSDYEVRLKLDDLRQLLQAAGITGEELPASWDGARLVLHINGMVMTEWEEIDAMLIQAPPPQLAVPDGFDLRRLTTLVLRGLNMPAAQASALGARMAAAPAWMLALDAGDKAGIREVALRHGTGTLVYDYDTDHPDRIERLTLLWSTPERIAIFSCGCGDAVAIAVANSMN